MCEVNYVIVIAKLHSESQCIVMTDSFALHGVLVVANISSSSDPSFSVLLGINLRVHKRSHSMVVQTVWLEQVYNVKSVGFASNCVLNSEVVPLSVASRVVIRLQN